MTFWVALLGAFVTLVALVGARFLYRFWWYNVAPRYAGDKALLLHTRPVDFHSPTLGPYYADLRKCLRAAVPDEGGIIAFETPMGRFYNPCAVAEYALVAFEDQLWAEPSEREAHRKIVRANLEWLVAAATPSGPGVCFYYTYDTEQEKAPWGSGIAQGIAISALLRGYQCFDDPRYLDLALKAFASMDAPVEQGGFRYQDSELALWYEEDNHQGHIVNGHVFALLGAHDLFRVTGEERFRHRFEAGIEALAASRPRFDLGFNTAYRLDERVPANNSYHLIHVTLFDVLARITGDERLARCSVRFREYQGAWWFQFRTAVHLLLLTILGRRRTLPPGLNFFAKRS